MRSRRLIAWLLATCALAGTAEAQFPLRMAPYEPPPAPRDWARGGFVALALGYSTVNGQPATLIGPRAGWMINHRLALGGAGYAMVAEQTSLARGTADVPARTSFDYGGLWAEYLLAPRRLAHASFAVLLGGGSIANERDDVTERDAVLVLDPTVSLEVNALPFMRVMLSANYRVVTGVSLVGLSDRDMTAAGLALALSFGKF
jgi:hypothetical protein